LAGVTERFPPFVISSVKGENAVNKDRKAQRAIEETEKEPVESTKHPSAGPHAKKQLTDKIKTPGAGTLTGTDENEVSPGSG
jgi:hypothetical protein